jgi:formylglycine-generating enzyme required for sulfatase activity
MIAWLAGAAEWAEPFVEHMKRRPGDWSTVRDRSPRTYPAVLVHRRTGLEFVYVPAGSFGIGGRSRSPSETPHRYVAIRGFYVSRTECTRAAWAAGRREPPPPVRVGRLPATDVPFIEAAAWCHAQGLDLPTEAQWELAAAGVGAREYPWGDERCQPNVKRAFHSSDLAEVGSVDCDRSPCGAMDMAGNVREWCYPVSNATYRILPEDVQDPPARRDGIVVRGASWQNPLKDGRTHHRVFTQGSPTEVGSADPTVGFRPVLSR